MAEVHWNGSSLIDRGLLSFRFFPFRHNDWKFVIIGVTSSSFSNAVWYIRDLPNPSFRRRHIPPEENISFWMRTSARYAPIFLIIDFPLHTFTIDAPFSIPMRSITNLRANGNLRANYARMEFFRASFRGYASLSRRTRIRKRYPIYLISARTYAWRMAEMCLGPWPRFKFNTPLRKRKSSSPYDAFQFTFRHPVTLPGRPLCRVYRRVVLQHVPFGWFRALSHRRLSSGTNVTRMTRVSDTAVRTFLSLSLFFPSCR